MNKRFLFAFNTDLDLKDNLSLSSLLTLAQLVFGTGSVKHENAGGKVTRRTMKTSN